MNARFETAPRCTPAGVSTVTILTLVLLMGASTLWTPQSDGTGEVAAAAGPVHVVQAHGASPVKKS